MKITSVRSTYCFRPLGDRDAQVVRVVVAGAPAGEDATLSLAGRGVEAPQSWHGHLDPALAAQPGGPAWAPHNDRGLVGAGQFTPSPGLPDGVVVELAAVVDDRRRAGDQLPVSVRLECGGQVLETVADIEVQRPGWRMLMVPHFHYDPVWWNTQAGYTSGWDELVWAIERRASFQHTGLALVEAHLQRARLDPLYKFVLAEVDYLKPFWDLYPDRRAEMKELIAAGRLEVVGGTYNEPNTNLTGAETAIRAAVYGLGFQRDVVGAAPDSAWQLDVFGHDPQFPGIMAECGLTSSAWARGPFHQWGPHKEVGSNRWMQFPSEFEWVAPNGKGLLTSYMPNHYSAGWELERATTLEGAMWRAYELFTDLAEVSATRVTLLPVGTDYTPPSRFVTDVARAWAARYSWPRFEVGIPRQFFEAVRAELAERGTAPSPQTRDMNPVYTGKDVSFIDTKQAQRLAETCLADAEAMAAVAGVLGAPVPHRALDKAWRQLVFGAHHDGITGSESDQVYLDLLAGWREAHDLAAAVEESSRQALLGAVDTTGVGDAVVVTNMTGLDRSDIVSFDFPTPDGDGSVQVQAATGGPLPALTEPALGPGSVRLSFRAGDVPGLGYRTFRLVRSEQPGQTAPGWVPAPGVVIANEYFGISAEPKRGGGLTRVTDRASGFELVPDGEVANELLVYPEYPDHPRFGEGPWHLLPAGPPVRSRQGLAGVRRERCALGQRLVVEGRMSLRPRTGHHGGPHDHDGTGTLAYRQVVTLWDGVRRVDLRTEIHQWSARDQLVRLRFPTVLAGASAVSAVGDAVIGRSLGLIDVDVAQAPWTLDNPAADWFGLSANLLVEAHEDGEPYHQRSVAVAEVVTPDEAGGAPWARDLVVALVQKGVTATCSEAQRNRYGGLQGDSNLPDFRIAIGRPDENRFVAGLLEAAGPGYRAHFENDLARAGTARLLVPPEKPLAEVWRPNADLRHARALPVLVVAGRDAMAAQQAVAELTAEITQACVRVNQPAGLVPQKERAPTWTAAIFNRGTPGFAVDSSGALYVSLLRACTGWPSGVWIDPPRRTAPDGSAFQLEHWSHIFENALAVAPGDWRHAGWVAAAQAYNRPMRATVVGAHPGVLPAHATLFSLKPAGADTAHQRGSAVLTTLKPSGHPLASGDDTPGDRPAHEDVELTLRCYEAHGFPVEVEVGSSFTIGLAHRADLLEAVALEAAGTEVAGPEVAGPEVAGPEVAGPEVAGAGEGALPVRPGAGGGTLVTLDLGPYALSTLRLRVRPAGPAGGDAGRGPDALMAAAVSSEVAQPVFSRYWLHNKGAAPLGNQALAVHVLTTAMVVRAGATGTFTAQVASGAARRDQAGRLELSGPPGWAIEPPSRIFSLAPGAFVREEVRFEVPFDCRPGRHFLSARVLDAAGQAQEDVVTVDVLPHLAEDIDLPAPFGHPSGQFAAELEAVLLVDALTVGPGGLAQMGLWLKNRTVDVLRGEVQLVSPVETWPLVGPPLQGFSLRPGEERHVHAAVRGLNEGWLTSWALFKVTYFGRLWYSPAVALELGRQSQYAPATAAQVPQAQRV